MDTESRELDEIAEDHPNVFRECAELFMKVLHHAVRIQPNSPQKWGVAFATANPICMGQSMSQVASQLGVSRAIISHEARRFCEQTGLPPSSYMGTKERAAKSQKSRNSTIQKMQCKRKKK